MPWTLFLAVFSPDFCYSAAAASHSFTLPGDLGLQFLDASLELIDDRRHCRFGESPEDVL